MSKYCHKCAIAKAKLGDGSPEFVEWYQNHQRECDVNHKDSSGAMEKAAAEVLWKRSQDFGFQYTRVVSDGDANAYKHVCNLQVYRPDVSIEKDECVNHVHKKYNFETTFF